MLRFRWSRLRRCYGDGAVAIDEEIVGSAPWRWWTGRLNRWDDEMDDGSSSGEVDEGHRVVVVDDVIGEEAPAGWRCGASRVFAASVYEWGLRGWDGNHGLGTRLSKVWRKLQKYPH